METGEGTHGKPEEMFEYVEERVINRHGLPDKRNHCVIHARIHRRRICSMRRPRPRGSVVLSDVEELDGVSSPIQVCCNRTSRLVAGRRTQYLRGRGRAW